jgi:hypothetical protein
VTELDLEAMRRRATYPDMRSDVLATWYPIDVPLLLDRVRAQEDLIAELEQEVRTWRWLHWGHSHHFWACKCGDAHGGGITEPCETCGTHRPAKGISTSTGLPKTDAELLTTRTPEQGE